MSGFYAIMIIIVMGGSTWYGGGSGVAIEQVEFIDLQTCEAALNAVKTMARESDGDHQSFVDAVCVTR